MGFRTGVRFSSGPLENGIVCCESDIQCRYFMVGCRCEFCKFGFAGLILVAIQCFIMIVSIYPTEKALKKHFNDDGIPR